MLDVLEAFRIRVSDRPLALAFAVLVALLAARRLSRSNAALSSSLLIRLGATGCLIALAVYVSAALWYASDPHFFDNAEPTMIAVGWLFHVGQPIYPAIDAAERYAHIYGPLAFILHGFALGAIAPSIFVSKGLGAAAGILSLAVLYLSIRRQTTQWRALTLTGFAALLLLTFRHYSYWTRPDPFQLVAVAAAISFAATSRAPFAAGAL